MSTNRIPAISLEEKTVVSAINLTFVFYLFGALYLVAPAMGWLLILFLIRQAVTTVPQPLKPVHPLLFLWLIGILSMLVVLVVGHLNANLGLTSIIKSSIGWAKGWALLAIFPVLGYCLNIRFEAITRAACFIGAQALIITPFLFIAYKVGLPQTLYVSPLEIIGGSGAEYFTVMLYEIDPGLGTPRWRFFAPWAPAVGFIANIYFLCALFEKDRRWQIVGLSGNMLMIVLAFSRIGLITLLLIPLAVWGLSRLSRPWMLITISISLFVCALFAEQIIELLEHTITAIKAARPDSTRVRETLANIALHRWRNEALWFGQGVVERGTHLVEFMPIGSHHTWYGLLFVKGLVGLICFAVPFFISIATLLVKAQLQHHSRLALGAILILMLFSFGENLEALAYLTWPAWLLIGMGLRSLPKFSKVIV